MIKVTILVPAYNEEKTIIQVLECVNEQVVPGVSFEILVVDDGSKDSTVALLEKNPELYTRLIKMPKNPMCRAGMEGERKRMSGCVPCSAITSVRAILFR